MPAYIIVMRERSRIQSELDTYANLAPATLAGHDFKMLALHGHVEVLEGPATEDVVMMSFPTIEAAKAWHGSPEYQKVAEHRYKGGDYRCFVFEGV